MGSHIGYAIEPEIWRQTPRGFLRHYYAYDEPPPRHKHNSRDRNKIRVILDGARRLPNITADENPTTGH